MLLSEEPIRLVLAKILGMISMKNIRINCVVVTVVFIEIILFVIDFLKQNELRS